MGFNELGSSAHDQLSPTISISSHFMHLEILNLYKQFKTKKGTLEALKNINLHVETGEFVCAVGASGSGKIYFIEADRWFRISYFRENYSR